MAHGISLTNRNLIQRIKDYLRRGAFRLRGVGVKGNPPYRNHKPLGKRQQRKLGLIGKPSSTPKPDGTHTVERPKAGL